MTLADIISEVFLPFSLAIIMLGMGTTLIPADFTVIIKKPTAILIGFTNQLILLPIIGFSLAIAFDLSPVMSVGLMILASSPGGPPSNLITHACKGNIALSVTLTAITSMVSIVTIPFILTYALAYFVSGTGITIKLPVLDTIVQIMRITVIPISIGMLIRKFKPGFALRMKKAVHTGSSIIFILVLLAVLAANLEIIVAAMKEVAMVTLILNITTMGLGYLIATLFKLNFKSVISITVESGVQNGALAFVIATSILGNVEMAIPAGAYVIWMYLTSGILIWYLSKRSEAK
ncbi:MAG: BASS family bile acid:Na+ symporter [Salibacteraceae bacterium]|jgi:BASS family bile acid:Na+ symporter